MMIGLLGPDPLINRDNEENGNFKEQEKGNVKEVVVHGGLPSLLTPSCYDSVTIRRRRCHPPYFPKTCIHTQTHKHRRLPPGAAFRERESHAVPAQSLGRGSQ